MKPSWSAVSAVAVLLVTFPAPTFDLDRLVVNTTPSAPLGVYVRVEAALEPGNLLIVRLPERLAEWTVGRRYLGSGRFLLKQDAAKTGDRICRIANEVLLNGRVIAIAMTLDPMGRPLPNWQGCFVLDSHQVFLLSQKPASLDSRYYGVLDRATVVGTAIPLLTFGD